MTIGSSLLIKILLAAVGLVFVWFAVGELWTGVEDSTKLLVVAAAGFLTAAIIFP